MVKLLILLFLVNLLNNNWFWMEKNKQRKVINFQKIKKYSKMV